MQVAAGTGRSEGSAMPTATLIDQHARRHVARALDRVVNEQAAVISEHQPEWSTAASERTAQARATLELAATLAADLRAA
jgi:hypothetical protein